MSEENALPANGADFLKSIRDVAFVSAIYLYFTGWIYIYSYLDFFGLSLRQADIDFYYFLIYSVNVMTFLLIDHWFITLCVIIFFSFVIHFLKHQWIIYAIGVFLFALLYYSAVISGQSDGRKDFAYRGSSLLRVKFVVKPDKDTTHMKASANLQNTCKLQDNISEDFKMFNDSSKLRLLLDTKDEYVVIVADRAVTYCNAFSIDKKIYEIKKENVELTRITK